MAQASDTQIEALRPKDANSLKEFHHVIGTALRVMIHDELPKREEVTVKERGFVEVKRGGLLIERDLLQRKGTGELVPAIVVNGKGWDGTMVVWIHPRGKASLFKDGKLVPAAQKIIDGKAGIFAPDVFLTGEFGDAKPMPIDKNYAGYTFGYNRPLLANRVHDILTAVAANTGEERVKKVHLVGWEAAGPWVLLARGLCGDAVTRTAADVNQFNFLKVRTTTDDMMLPGALKYGNLSALTALAAPGELFIHNNRASGIGKWVKAAYEAAGKADACEKAGDKVEPEKVVDWLLR
jgi:hypothetical protein